MKPGATEIAIINSIKRNKMKNKYKFLLVVVIIIVGAILVDWKNFKAGILGQPPVVNVESVK